MVRPCSLLPKRVRPFDILAAMKIVIAPQEFKGSLSAVQAAQAMAEGLGRALPDATLELVPMADGGPGTVEAVVAAAKNGRWMTAAAHDALGRPLEAAWASLTTVAPSSRWPLPPA